MLFSQLTLATCFGTRCLHACIWHQVSRNISPLTPGRSVEGGNLPIDELMGVKAVDSIDLSERGLGTMSAIIISACIAVNRHLRKLKLSGNKLGNEGAKALASGIRDSPSMTECTLRGNELGVEGWTTIFTALCDSPASRISTWDLSWEKLGPEIAEPLASYISVTASVTSVSVMGIGS